MGLSSPAFLASTRRKPWPLFSLLRLWLDPADLDGANNSTLTDGAPVNTPMLKGTLGGPFAGATLGGRPILRSGIGVGGGPATEWTNAAGLPPMSGRPASDWAFLHDGSGCTIFAAVKATVSHFGTIVATSSGSLIDRGIGFRINTTQRVGFYMSDGTALHVNTSAPLPSPTGDYHILAAICANEIISPPDDVELFGDSSTPLVGANSAAFSVAAPASTLSLGRTSSAANRLFGLLGPVLIYGARLIPAEIDDVIAAFVRRYGAFPQ